MADVAEMKKTCKIRARKALTAQHYEGYNIDRIYSNTNGNRIYFEDTSKDIPVFVFDFRTRVLCLDILDAEGKLVPAKYSYIRKITNGIRPIKDIAKKSGAPFWVVSYLSMVLATTHSDRIGCFYNAFAYDKITPYPCFLSRMELAETVAKQGFEMGLTYMPSPKHLEAVKSHLALARKHLGAWTDPYAPWSADKSYFGSLGDTYRLEGRVSTYSDPYLSTYLDEALKLNPDYHRWFLNREGFYKLSAISNILFLKDLGYDAKRLAKYLAQDSDYQGLSVLSLEALDLLKDYARMSSELLLGTNQKFTRYPVYLKTFHDIVARNHRSLADELNNKKFADSADKLTELLPYLKVKDPTFEVLIPQTAQELVREGAEQHHCVASYVKGVADKDTAVVFVRKSETLEEALVTVEICGLLTKDGDRMPYVNQAKGFSNRPVDEAEHEFLKKFCKMNGISYGRD